MEIEERIEAFRKLGDRIKYHLGGDLDKLHAGASVENAWFTRDSVENALKGILSMLSGDKVSAWASTYDLSIENPKVIGIVMAGNIPLVGFHDLISVLVSGHVAQIKTSSKDTFLVKQLIGWIVEIEPKFDQFIRIVEKLNDFDAVIATGSDNSARYFEYYFGKYPSVVRKNRTSIAILQGSESDDELISLGHDVFDYFGLGCRNVSKLYVPKGFDLIRLLDTWQEFSEIGNHHKYRNNYDYHKSILLVNGNKHMDTGFSLLRESDELVSPISLNYYQYYQSQEELSAFLEPLKDKIQCVVGKTEPTSIPFGNSQRPELWDYADGVDTMEFLSKL